MQDETEVQKSPKDQKMFIWFFFGVLAFYKNIDDKHEYFFTHFLIHQNQETLQ